MARRVLVCYDGSAGAVHALDEAARLFPGAHATIGYVWQPPLPYGGVAYGGQIILPAEIQHDIADKARRNAEDVADKAVSRARSAGLEAEAVVHETAGPVWRQLLALADEVDADVVVAGSRGFGEIRALLLGSTSQALSHHSQRPLLIIRTPKEA